MRFIEKMDYTSQEMDLDSFSTGVFALPGEPAVVVNGLPPLPPNDGNLVPCPAMSYTELHRDEGFGKWLEGRVVRKFFEDQFYIGKVTKYDGEMHWYNVVYEDGDSEELEWSELKQILLPLDIDLPLKTLATKVVKRAQKPVQKSGKAGITNTETGVLESGQISNTKSAN